MDCPWTSKTDFSVSIFNKSFSYAYFNDIFFERIFLSSLYMILCCSCSLPFKVDAVQCCDEHDPVAKVIGCSTQSLNAYVISYISFSI